jgi:hypothetical protein
MSYHTLLQLVLMNDGMHDAVQEAHVQVFKLLLARGASTAAPEADRQTLQEMLYDHEGSENFELFQAALDAHNAALHP